MNRSGFVLSTLLLAAAVLATACEPSEVKDPNADVTITGRLLNHDGSPAPGADVLLTYDRDAIPLFTTTIASKAVSGPDVTYEFKLKGRDLNYEGGDAARLFRLSATRRPTPGELSRSDVRASFEVNRTNLPLDLQFWEAGAAEAQGTITWNGTKPGQGSTTKGDSAYELGLSTLSPDASATTDASGGIGSYRINSTRKSFDPRFFEDQTVHIGLNARRSVEAPGRSGVHGVHLWTVCVPRDGGSTGFTRKGLPPGSGFGPT